MPNAKEPFPNPSGSGSTTVRAEPTYPDHSSAWDGRRRSKMVTDRALTGAALDWLISLPAHLRPKQLCDRFPRIANSLALAWKDRPGCLAMLTALLGDARERRRGFPVVLRQEIQRLVEYREKQAW